MRLRTVILSTVAVALLTACIGPVNLIGPTTQTVTPADIVGTWQYPADFGATTITLDLKSNGTFVQTVKHGSGLVETHEGTWTLNGTTPVLSVLKPDFGDPKKNWAVEAANWWVVDSSQSGVKFAIFGAADDRDPDSCWEFAKVR